MKKYRTAAVCAAMVFLICIVLMPAGIKAWFTDRDEITNTFSVGINTIIPEEPFDPPEPGKTTEKKPSAVNTGTVSCFVRARVMVSDSSAEQFLTYYCGETEGMNTADWTLASDGWLYLKKELLPGETSAPVFEKIALDGSIPDDKKGFTIDVIFESVQTTGFDDFTEAFRAVG